MGNDEYDNIYYILYFSKLPVQLTITNIVSILTVYI